MIVIIRRLFSLLSPSSRSNHIVDEKNNASDTSTCIWNQLDCPICLEEFVNIKSKLVTTMKCGHKFCSNCLYHWDNHQKTRDPTQTTYTYLLDNHREKKGKVQNAKKKRHRVSHNRTKRHINDDHMSSAESSEELNCPICDQ